MMAAEENAYELLGLPQGSAATDAEIKKVTS
jgi:curved DNA-binding protein CbpA